MRFRQLALAALVVGTLDIAEVIVFYWLRGVAPIRVVQGVATGLFGPASFQGGLRTALIGLALHFFIATVVVCVYYAASLKLAVLRRAPVAIGVVYGLAVYAFMNAVVLPLSAAGPSKFVLPVVLNGLFAHVFCVGIPTGLLARARGTSPES
jgi:hypothetical protein